MIAAIDNTPIQPSTGWRSFASDKGRLWATRVEPFTPAQERAGAFRTVDADDETALNAEIAEQERLAQSAT